MSKKTQLPMYLGIAIAFGILIGSTLNFKNSANSIFKSNSKETKIKRLIDYIQYDYVDDVNTDSIVDVTVNKILGDLDPHSVYIPKKNLEGVTESMNGEFVGIGVSFYVRKDTISIIKTIADGPSRRAGIKAGDKILLANSDTLYGSGMTNDKVIQKLKGEIDSKVTLTIYRASEDKKIKITVKRGVVALKSVPIAYMVEDGLGYIKINRFAETTFTEFKKELLKLKRKGMTNLILDLRGNPGGFLDRAQQVVDEFLEDDKLILFTKNKKGEVDKFFATSKGNFEKGGVFVLIDEESASASEIVAGALKDNKRALIMGKRSFGKGSVQSVVKMGDGSGLKLTVARYYTPNGISIQAEGITPDVVIEEVDGKAFSKAIINRKIRREADMKGHLSASKAKKHKGKTKSTSWWRKFNAKKKSSKSDLLADDYQVLQAYNYLKAWKVFKTL